MPSPETSLQAPAMAAQPSAQPAGGLTFLGSSARVMMAMMISLTVLSPVLVTLPAKAAITAALLVIAVVQMAFDGRPEQVLLEAVVLLVATGVITIKQAVHGFSSEGVVSVAVMTVLAKGVQSTGGLQLITRLLLGSPSTYIEALLRMLVATLSISAFLNNTPVVAMLMPVVVDWAQTIGLDKQGFSSVSKFLLLKAFLCTLGHMPCQWYS